MSIWFLVSCRRIWLKPTYANVMIIISHFTQGNFTYFEQIHQITIPGFFAHEIWNCKLGQLAQPVKPNQYFYVADNLRSGVASFLRAFAIYEKLSEGNTGGTKRRSRTGNMSGCLGRVQSDQAGPASPRFVALEERLGGSQVWGGQLRSPGWGMEIACWTSSAWPDLVLHCQPVWGGREKTRWRHTPGQAGGWTGSDRPENSQVQTVSQWRPPSVLLPPVTKLPPQSPSPTSQLTVIVRTQLSWAVIELCEDSPVQ